jgi:hypothetical protein
MDPSQQNIKSLFSKKTVEPVSKTASVVVTTETDALVSDDPIIKQYYDSLNEKERRAHTIAMDKLGTSYDVVRTHGFMRWQKARK